MAVKPLHLFLLALLALAPALALASDVAEDAAEAVDAGAEATLDAVVGGSGGAGGTDSATLEREEGAIKLDGLSVSEMKAMRDSSEKYHFQAEVNRMMKLIINSLYKNKEIFLRELISNASDALDKIRFQSLTDPSVIANKPELDIRIKADKENNALHILDTGIGMTHDDLVKHLGTIAKSGTSEFFEAVESGTDVAGLIGQFGVGFYSSFLVADTVVVTTKHNDGKQYIWESDSASFSIIEDPREDEQLGRGTRVSLFLKEEAHDFLEDDTLNSLIKKYSEFINFPIYLWKSKIEMVDEDATADEEADDESDDEDEEGEGEDDDESDDDEDEDGAVEEDDEEDDGAEKKQVERTVWEYVLMNANKPLWTRSAKEIDDEEYNNFYKAFSRDTEDPLSKIHFTAEGEVTFRSLMFVPKKAPNNMYQDYGKQSQNIKLYVRRVFITDEFDDFMPKYLSFIHGLVDSDDLPLNVSRETLQQHKLLKVIRKKLVRKALEMIKKMAEETEDDVEDEEEEDNEGEEKKHVETKYEKFWKEFGTNIKLGLIEDYSNRTRLAKLLRFASSAHPEKLTSLEEYVERMRKGQEQIYFLSGVTRKDVEESPFVERLVRKGYEVLYLVDAVDEYAIQNLPEFDGHKFQNVAKEGLKIASDSEKAKEREEELNAKFEPLTTWMRSTLTEFVDKVVVSNRLTDSPCALVAAAYGWSGNMERIMKAQAYSGQGDGSNDFYANQKKILEINPRHPVMKELLIKVEDNEADSKTEEQAQVLFDTAVLRSGFQMKDSAAFAGRIERLLRASLDIADDVEVEEEEEFEDDDLEEVEDEDEDEEDEADDDDEEEEEEEEGAEEEVAEDSHDEL